MSSPLSRFAIMMSVVCVTVTLLFGIEATIFGLCVVGIGILVFSFEPFTSGVTAIVLLVGAAVFVDPVAAAGATIVALVSGAYGIFILVAKARRNAERVKRTSKNHNM